MITSKGPNSSSLNDRRKLRILGNFPESSYQLPNRAVQFLVLLKSSAFALLQAPLSFFRSCVAGISCWYRKLQASRICFPRQVLEAHRFSYRTTLNSWRLLPRALKDTSATAKVRCDQVKSASVLMRNQALGIPNCFDSFQNARCHSWSFVPATDFPNRSSFFKAFKKNVQWKARAFKYHFSTTCFGIAVDQIRIFLKELPKQSLSAFHVGIILSFLISVQPLRASSIIQKPLDEHIVYEVPIAWEAGTTTILFPSEISALYGKSIATQEQPNANFLISFLPGNYYVTLRALEKGAEDYLTIIFNRKAYIFHLIASDAPFRTLTLFNPDKNRTGRTINPSQLLSLLDKAKAYSLFKAQHSDALEGVLHVSPNIENPYQDFTVKIKNVWRFEPQDTLVFGLELINQSKTTISYRPQDLAIKLGERIYTQSIVDASGSMPPNSITPAFFAITGDGSGGRNHLSPDNNWSVLVIREPKDNKPAGSKL